MTTATKLPPVVIPPETLIHFLTDMDMVLFAAYLRLKCECNQQVTGIYEATLSRLARIGVDKDILCQLVARNLIRWMEHGNEQAISIV